MDSLGWWDWPTVAALFVFLGALAALGVVFWMRWTGEGEAPTAAGRRHEARQEPPQDLPKAA